MSAEAETSHRLEKKKKKEKPNQNPVRQGPFAVCGERQRDHSRKGQIC